MSPGVDPVAFVGERLQTSKPARQLLRYVFPDHWSFLLGEMALYSFVMLIATGVPLALFFDPSSSEVVWHGPYAPLDGETVSSAYASALNLSFKVPGGLLLRQTHHWAALLFLVAIVFHLIRIVFTLAFRKPREMNYWLGLTMLIVALLEGYAGYSLLDDLLSGMGLAIGNGAALSIPGIGGAVGSLIWDGAFPGGPGFFSRLYIAHVFIFPVAIATVLAVHLALVARPHHTQFPGPGRKERNVVGSPTWPGYALRSLGFFAATAGVLVTLGGLVQINPIWQYGPFEPWLGENGAQPDWYLGWLIGTLRMMPNVELHLFGVTFAPNPVFGGLIFPGVVFGVLFSWPWLERRFGGDPDQHHLLDRPRDRPRHSAWAAALLTWIATVFLAGSADRIFLGVGVSYELQVTIARVLFFVAPVVVWFVTRRICERLRREERHPLREVDGRVVQRPPTRERERTGR